LVTDHNDMITKHDQEGLQRGVDRPTHLPDTAFSIWSELTGATISSLERLMRISCQRLCQPALSPAVTMLKLA
jgi:hypothetical protein